MLICKDTMKIMHSVQPKNNRKEKFMYLILRGLFLRQTCYIFIWFIIFVFTDKIIFYQLSFENKLSDMRKKIILRFSENRLYENLKIFQIIFLKYLLRGKLFKFITNLTNRIKKF